jgi:microcompartment protein CcmK/EutM
MLIARVIGTTVSTIKDEKLTGRKLLICRQTDERGEPVGKPYVAVDTVDAGVGDLVLTAAGSSARQTTITKDTPVDAVIMSIIDSLEVAGEVVYRQGEESPQPSQARAAEDTPLTTPTGTRSARGARDKAIDEAREGADG